MGYISSDMNLDAILTKKGRELLTNNPDQFKITKFSLSDDEVDYSLWNTSHSLGTDYYGELIENTPIIEPLPGEEQQAKFRLLTLPKETVNLPQLVVGSNEVTLYPDQEYLVSPQSVPNTFDLTAGYTMTTWDFDFKFGGFPAELLPGTTSLGSTQLNLPGFSVFGRPTGPGPGSRGRTAIPSTQSTLVAIGKTFTLKGVYPWEDSLDHYYRVTIVGNETGARVTMNITVKGKYALRA
jgi:hypothetical protein